MPPKKSQTKLIKSSESENISKKNILVIVESPGKIKKIQSILGDNYIVTASVGHIIDLPSKEMSIDIQNNFKPTYEPMHDKIKVIKELKALAKTADEILLATDEDREGEMIAWTLQYVLNIENAKRITFNSITKDELIKAVQNPRQIDYNLVDAQKTRRMLDRIVGYEISPLLWKTIGQSLSAGRVQSVVVRLILEKERDIQKFLESDIKSEYKFKSKFIHASNKYDAQLYQVNKPKNILENMDEIIINDEEIVNEQEIVDNKLIKGYKAVILTEKIARDLMDKFIKSEYKISAKGDTVQIRNPTPPFTTSTLQQEASRKFGFTIQRTMMAAQHLYETGHITYMRTDSVNLSAEAIKNIGDYIKDTYGNEYHKQTYYKSKSNNTQEAHEAIRPTHIEITGINQTGKIGSDESKLYNLIWKRSIASQMSPAKLNVATTQINISKTKEYYFQSDITSIIFDGFLKVYNLQNLEDLNGDDNSLQKNIININDKLKLNKLDMIQDYQKPPTRYNEASLVNKLDPKNLNIGRPSTYASIITKIQERKYVEKKDNDGITKNVLHLEWDSEDKEINEKTETINLGKDVGKLCPTSIGSVVTDFLIQYFPQIMDYKFTSNLEEKLDQVAEGKMDFTNLMKEFYHNDFHPIVENLSKEKIKFVDKDMREIGINEDGDRIIATVRRFGPVVYIEKNGKEHNIAPIKSPLTIKNITLEDAQKILSYPKLIGKIGRTQVKLYKGAYGFYAKYGDTKVNLSKIQNEEDITIEKIIELEKEKKSYYLWEHKEGKIHYTVMDGQYGKYISMKDTTKKTNKPLNTKLPQDIEIKDLTLIKVKEIIEEGKKNRFKKKIKKE